MSFPVVTVEQMRVADENAGVPEAELINRAGRAVGELAVSMLEDGDGRAVCVLVGPGNNGADGKVAAEFLQERNFEVTVIAVEDMPEELEGYDLVIDAIYGTGFRGAFTAPETGDAQVLSVDIPSGLNGDTGHAHGLPFLADATLSLGGIKTGLMFGEGPEFCGESRVDSLGMEIEEFVAELISLDDVLEWLPERSRVANKWSAAACVVAGCPEMLGAGDLCALGAYRAGAGMVRLCQPGVEVPSSKVTEAVLHAMPLYSTADVLSEAERCHAVAIGPGMGRSANAVTLVRVGE